MVASRNRPKGLGAGPFGLSLLMLSVLPAEIAPQDHAALAAEHSDHPMRWRLQFASPVGAAHAASFNFPRPVGTAIPEPPRPQVPKIRLASLTAGTVEMTGSIARDFGIVPLPRPRPPDYPTINRRLKGDLLVPRLRPEPDAGPSRDLTPGRVKTVSFPRPQDPPPAAPAAIDPPSAPVPDAAVTHAPLDALADPIEDGNPAVRLSRLYFGSDPVDRSVGAIEPWPDEEMMFVTPSDPDIKRSALAPLPAAPDAGEPAETLAPKGEVTGPGKRPRTPAERLGLDVKSRAKAEKCLAEAVYFESRGESKRGQIAVAQVVMNRVFSGFYPTDVCGVVYQNAHRYLACQFTFACDGIKDVVTEPEMWEQAKDIARDTLDGKVWLPEIGKSTHYHAYWVHPWWVGTMRKLSKIGVHTFYRPRRWGDGADEPVWGPAAAAPDEGAAKL
jgi:spore germination cell wall hydrolase CwlJ-like protein